MGDHRVVRDHDHHYVDPRTSATPMDLSEVLATTSPLPTEATFAAAGRTRRHEPAIPAAVDAHEAAMPVRLPVRRN